MEGIFLGTVAFFAHPAIASAIFERAHLLVQLLFTPLVAGWSIWAGIAVSTRLSDVRAAQQVAIFASLPPLAIVSLMNFNVIKRVGIELRRGTFDVVVDGNSAGRIEHHDTVEVPIDPGPHTIRIRAGRYSSPEHSFEASDGETITFRIHGAMMWPRYVGPPHHQT